MPLVNAAAAHLGWGAESWRWVHRGMGGGGRQVRGGGGWGVRAGEE